MADNFGKEPEYYANLAGVCTDRMELLKRAMSRRPVNVRKYRHVFEEEIEFHFDKVGEIDYEIGALKDGLEMSREAVASVLNSPDKSSLPVYEERVKEHQKGIRKLGSEKRACRKYAELFFNILEGRKIDREYAESRLEIYRGQWEGLEIMKAAAAGGW